MTMTDWYTYALAAFFLMGAQNFLYKVSAERGCHSGWVTFSFTATVAGLSGILWLIRWEPVASPGLLLALSLLNGLSFLIATVTHIESLKYLPATTVYSITRLNLVVVTAFSVIFLKDRLSFGQIAGILCAVGAIPILTVGPGKDEAAKGRGRQGFVYLAVCLSASTVALISSKYAAMHVSKIAFMTLVYTMATLASTAFGNRFRTSVAKNSYGFTFSLGLIRRRRLLSNQTPASASCRYMNAFSGVRGNDGGSLSCRTLRSACSTAKYAPSPCTNGGSPIALELHTA